MSFIMNIQLFQCGDRLKTSKSDAYKHQIMISKVGPRADRVKCHASSIEMSVESVW